MQLHAICKLHRERPSPCITISGRAALHQQIVMRETRETGVQEPMKTELDMATMVRHNERTVKSNTS